jgi:nicotinate-nucleotide--dimethylbenzimidazole phosphoribosyltransferase
VNDTIDTQWTCLPAALPDADIIDQAWKRQAELTKPPGSLGRLEDLAIRLAGLQGTTRPKVERVHITVFAGDHGVAVEGVSAFPQAVTAEMVKNFAAGGAAISVAARTLGAQLEVINLGTASPTGELENLRNVYLGPGTANFAQQAAMTRDQLTRALAAGRDAVERARNSGVELYIGGDMGIANTTAATALACALLKADPAALTGPGTGLSPAGVSHKAQVIEAALALHKNKMSSPLDTLQYLGGFEIAALAGAYIACAQNGLPVLVDGFICSAAALVAMHINPGTKECLLFSHVSAEPGHRAVLEALDARPLLELGMRLGEGSGAAVAVPLLRLACAFHNEMATFGEAEVSTGDVRCEM